MLGGGFCAARPPAKLSWCVVTLWMAAVACGTSPPDVAADWAVCSPTAVGLTISEVMADSAGLDRGQEWIELFNAGPEGIGLDRLEVRLGRPGALRRATLVGLGVLPPQHIVVLGDGEVGRAPIDASYGALELPNAGGSIDIDCQGVSLAHLSYGDVPSADDWAPAPIAGRSLSRHADRGGVWAANTWFATSGPTYDGTNVGTPGAPNLARFVCRDADGGWRAQRRAGVGELRIAAVYADPPGPDGGREWLALQVVGQDAVDLNDLRVEAQAAHHRLRRWQLGDEACLTAAAGQQITLHVFGHEGPSSLAAVPPGDAVLWGPTLPNGPMCLRLRQEAGEDQDLSGPPLKTPDGSWLDAVTLPKAVEGAAWFRLPECVASGCGEGRYRPVLAAQDRSAFFLASEAGADVPPSPTSQPLAPIP